VLLIIFYILYYINKKFSGSRILRNPESASVLRVSRWLYSGIQLIASPYTGVFLLTEVFVLTSEATVADGILGQPANRYRILGQSANRYRILGQSANRYRILG
jgi:hypothetical protein